MTINTGPEISRRETVSHRGAVDHAGQLLLFLSVLHGRRVETRATTGQLTWHSECDELK